MEMLLCLYRGIDQEVIYGVTGTFMGNSLTLLWDGAGGWQWFLRPTVQADDMFLQWHTEMESADVRLVPPPAVVHIPEPPTSFEIFTHSQEVTSFFGWFRDAERVIASHISRCFPTARWEAG